ncbi:MAG: ThuA domain-containing protein [Pirellulaceae bacterium]
MKIHSLLVAIALTLFGACSVSADEKLKVLIVDGQNNHGAWPKTTMMMKEYYEQSGRFDVDIERTKYTWKGDEFLDKFPLAGVSTEITQQPKSDPNFAPDFAAYDVVVSNFGWNAAAWPKKTQAAFEAYMQSGGGLVVIHAANNSFPEWDEYNKMIGLGGWGGRDELAGPYVYLNDKLEEVRDTSKGSGGGHGPRHEYQVVVRNTNHPITKGLPTSWLHTSDELYERLRGPANNMTILATAFADPKFKGSNRHEPMMMVIDYKKGHVFHTAMGHDALSFECVAFITTLLRGTEWAATGEVTLTEIPEDYPTSSSLSRRPFDK